LFSHFLLFQKGVAMRKFKIRIFLTSENFRLTKDLELTHVPQKDCELMILMKNGKGYASAKVSKESQFYIDEDLIVIWCDVDLKCLCLLYVNGMISETDWKIDNLHDFLSSHNVKEVINCINNSYSCT